MWIEVFSGGLHRNSAGEKKFYNIEALQNIVDKYNNKVKSDSSYLAPVVKGHPQSDAPAYGWVEQLARNGYKILAKLKDVSKDLLEEIRDGKFRKVSVSLYPNLLLKHIGLLGASAPAVKGLQNLNYVEEEVLQSNGTILCHTDFTNFYHKDIEVNNSDSRINEFNEQLITGLLKENSLLEQENIKLKDELKKHKESQRKKELQEFVESLNTGEKAYFFSQSQLDNLQEILELASQYEENIDLETEKSLVLAIKNFVVNNLEHYNKELLFSNLQGHNVSMEEEQFSQKVVSPERWQMHLRAKQILAENPNMSYEEAILLSQNT